MRTVKSPCVCNRVTDFDEIWHDDAYWPSTAERPLNIGADSTGATGNFAPVLTQEPGQTLRFAPVPFMAVLWFFKW